MNIDEKKTKKSIFDKLLFPILILGFGLAFYEQSKSKPNVIFLGIGIGIVVFGMIKLSSKIPNKKEEKDEDTI